MSSFKRSRSFLFIALFTAFLFSHITALPIAKDSPYDKYIDFLKKNNCTMPDIELPFSSPFAPSQSNFSFLSEPLQECQTSSAEKETEEAMFLCSEIFDVLGNISCSKYNIQLPKINVPLSQDICGDFKSMESIFPKGGEFLSGKLADGTLCKLLCSKSYEPLCKTLLWSYGVQAKIRSFLENSIKVDDKPDTVKKAASKMGILENAIKVDNTPDMDANAASKTGTTSIKVHLGEGASGSSKQTSNEMTGNNDDAEDAISEDKKATLGVSDSNNAKSSSVGATSSSEQTALSKAVKLTNNALNETSTGNTSLPKGSTVPVGSENEPESNGEKFSSNDNMQPVESNQNPQPEQKQNEVNVDSHSDSVKGVDKIPVNPNAKVSSSTPDLSSVTEKNGKSTPLSSFPDKESPSAVSESAEPETNINSNSFVPQNNEMNNELNNVDLDGEEKEGKFKPTNVQIDDKKKKTEKPELTDFETSLDSDVDLKQLESTTLRILPDGEEDGEHQEDKEQEQYNDTENEGIYPKEYENSFNLPSKNKEPSVKSSPAEGSNQMPNYDILVSSRNNIGRIPDDGRIISAFPEQEDSHFFFYFLSIVLILMAGYLIFHNKQKIIALIVEGRHERRRRSHGAGYKKLETK